MKRRYERPVIAVEKFVPNQCIAGCDWSIVSGTDAVKVYCAKTSYTTVFTNTNNDCHYKHNAFTSTSEATTFFSNLFQWGSDVQEATNGSNYTGNWGDDRKERAENEIKNGFSLRYSDTIKIGNNNSGVTHAGYALDFLNGTGEGKALS